MSQTETPSDKTSNPCDPSSAKPESAPVAATPEVGERRVNKYNFFIVPIPKPARWDPGQPTKFGWILKMVFLIASTAACSNVNYCVSDFIVFANHFGVSYADSTNVNTLGIVGSAIGVALVAPLGDRVPRRPLILILAAASVAINLGESFVPTFVPFEILSLLVGITASVLQVLTALAADLAAEDEQTHSVGFVTAGILLGQIFGRVVGGTVGHFGTVPEIFWMSSGLQALVLIMLWATIPDCPRKNPDMTFVQLYKSMGKFFVTEPIILQSCISQFFNFIFICGFWGSFTFALGNTYGYNSFEIGLISLVGFPAVVTAPFVGRVLDKLIIPWAGVLFGIGIVLVGTSILTGAGGVNLAAFLIAAYILDLGAQCLELSSFSRSIILEPSATARISALLEFSILVGNTIGNAGPPRIFLQFGFHGLGASFFIVSALMLGLLLSRGPHCPRKKWFGGWEYGYDIRRRSVEEGESAEGAEKGGKSV